MEDISKFFRSSSKKRDLGDTSKTRRSKENTRRKLCKFMTSKFDKLEKDRKEKENNN